MLLHVRRDVSPRGRTDGRWRLGGEVRSVSRELSDVSDLRHLIARDAQIAVAVCADAEAM
jgi:hypothetical protein